MEEDNEKKEYEKFEEYLIKENNKNEFEENEKLILSLMKKMKKKKVKWKYK